MRKNLVKQFNELRDQLDKLADDASFNGINLLRGDKLKMTFNETGTSTLDIQAKDINGNPTIDQRRQSRHLFAGRCGCRRRRQHRHASRSV